MSTFNRTDDDLTTEIQALKDEMTRFKNDRYGGGADGDSLIERGKRTAKVIKDKVTYGVRTGLDTSGEYVRQRPGTTLLVALGIGVLIGAWWSRRD